jgi:hypothetical protein
VVKELPDGFLLTCVQFRRTKSLLKGAHGIAAASCLTISLSEIGERGTEGLMISSSQENELLQGLNLSCAVTGRIGGSGQKKEGLLILPGLDKTSCLLKRFPGFSCFRQRSDQDDPG